MSRKIGYLMIRRQLTGDADVLEFFDNLEDIKVWDGELRVVKQLSDEDYQKANKVIKEIP